MKKNKIDCIINTWTNRLSLGCYRYTIKLYSFYFGVQYYQLFPGKTKFKGE